MGSSSIDIIHNEKIKEVKQVFLPVRDESTRLLIATLTKEVSKQVVQVLH